MDFWYLREGLKYEKPIPVIIFDIIEVFKNVKINIKYKFNWFYSYIWVKKKKKVKPNETLNMSLTLSMKKYDLKCILKNICMWWCLSKTIFNPRILIGYVNGGD